MAFFQQRGEGVFVSWLDCFIGALMGTFVCFHGLITQKVQKEMVPRVGLEPTLSCPNQILNLARLPISPPRHTAGT